MSRLCPTTHIHQLQECINLLEVVMKILKQHIHTFRREQEHTMTYLYSRTVTGKRPWSVIVNNTNHIYNNNNDRNYLRKPTGWGRSPPRLLLG